jgi:acetyl esterase/lipase
MGCMTGYSRLAAIAACAVLGLAAPVAPLAAGAPPPLAVYGKLPGVERVAISRSGDHVAMIGVVDGVRSLLVLDQDKKSMLAFPMGDAKIRGLYWAGDDRILVYKSDTTKLVGYTTDKAELYTMVVIPLDGGKLWPVFGREPKIKGGVRQYLGVQEREGRYYGYFSGITLDGDFRSTDPYLTNTNPVLYEVDLQTQQTRAIAPRLEGRGSRDWVMGPGGKVGATLDYLSTSGGWTIRNGDGTKIGEGVNPLGRIGLVSLGATADTVLFSDQRKGDEERLYELPLAGGASKEVLTDAPLDAAYFDEQTGRLAGYRKEGDIPAYSFFDAYRQKVVNGTMKAFPGLSVKLIGWNDRFDRVIVMTEGAGDPQTWWMVDIKTGQARDLGVSYPIDAADVGPMRMVQYKAADGQEIGAVLTLPPGRPAKTLPVVIFPHGGPAARDYPVFDWWAQAFASRGYAVLQPNFRGSTGYGIAFRRAGHGEWGRKMQSDISDGLAFLAAQGIADPKRACIMGASYGGYAALAGVTLQHGLYRCAVAVAGVSDVARMAAADISGSGYDATMKRAIEEEIGARQDLRLVSPVNFAAQADAPILLVHGKDDSVVPYGQSSDMAAALRRAGKPVELLTLPSEDHWLSQGETRLKMLEAAIAFVEAHNPLDPAP